MMASVIQETILVVLEQNGGEFHGIEALALELNCADRFWLRRILQRAEANKQIRIIRSNGGRGNKNIIKRNRNSAGYPRKV
jgi:hypothetical protein